MLTRKFTNNFLLTIWVAAAFLTVQYAAAEESQKQTPRNPPIGLALGSGGAAGLAHIAMLQVFDDLGIKPERITGTSIGAVIGSLYASGLTAKEIRDIFDEFAGSNLETFFRLVEGDSGLTLDKALTFDLSHGGLLDSSGFLAFLASKTKARSFTDLCIPLEVVATDYSTGTSVILDKGDLFQAVEASMAVPGLFSPMALGSKLLIDGGTSNPLPFDLLTDRYDMVVAIDVTSSGETKQREEVVFTDVLFRAFEIMQNSMILARLEDQRPKIYIKTDIKNIRLLHFNRIESILSQAEPAAKSLKRQLSKWLEENAHNWKGSVDPCLDKDS